jgi:hypothetical protein
MKRTKWDYLISRNEEELTPLGQEGWELVSVVPAPDGKASRFYYKRPAPEEMTGASPERYRELKEQFPHVHIRVVPHLEFKQIAPESRAVIKTGDTTPYANIIIVSG